MKSLQLVAARKFAHAEIPEPPAPGPGEALVRTHRMGVCGTDISAYLGKFPFFEFPRIPGHELGVEVLEVGEGVRHVKPGDRCSIEPYMNCGECIACRKGRTNCCAHLRVLGVMYDGGLCERFTLRADKLHVSEKLSYDQLALVETLAIGCHAVQRAECGPGDHVLVVGAGPIGLSAIEFVKLSGAKTVVTDLNEYRLEFCRTRMGVDAAIPVGEGLEEELRQLTDGNLPDVVIDATGNAKSMSHAFTLLAPTGRLVFVGITTDPITLNQPPFHKLEGTLLSTRNALPEDFRRIIQLIEDGKIDTDPWISHRTRFDDVIADFPSFIGPDAGVVKAIIEVV
ncbi:MAG: zinc-binding alcohol dehydrogenase family protein [Planctomycetaceae bacterium]